MAYDEAGCNCQSKRKRICGKKERKDLEKGKSY